MAKASEQFRQSDVTLWGIVALVCGGLAVFGANISAVLPQNVIGVLHQPRLASASLDTLRIQVADLRQEAVRLKRENDTLVSRFSLQEQEGNDLTRRVGALEVSIPQLVEALPESSAIDRNSLTASIGDNDATLTFNADGGSVKVRQTPMPLAVPSTDLGQPLPAPIADTSHATPDAASYGIAIGSPVPFENAPTRWNELSVKLGPLLFGLTPLLVDEANSTDKLIVVGPISQIDEARSLCERLEKVSVSCMPMPFLGTPLDVSAVDGKREGG